MLLVAINAVASALVFGYFAQENVKSDQAAALSAGEELVYTVSGTIEPAGSVNAARILSWPNWSKFADAIIVDSHFEPADGGWRPRGVALNPLGSSERGSGIDEQQVHTALALAVQHGKIVDEVEGGRVVPIRQGRATWGACWYRVKAGQSRAELFVHYFLPGFLLSTLFVSAGAYFMLSRFVIAPVERLAAGARAVARGDFSVRIPEPTSNDELSQLVRTFNAMTGEVAGFNRKLALEVEKARAEAQRAEAAALKERRLAAMGELAAGIAHEINNPLGGLQNAVDVLSEGKLSPEKRTQYLALLSNGLERIRLTVGRLLRFTPREAHRTKVSLAAPVCDAIRLIAHRASSGAVALRFVDADGAGSLEELEARWARLPQLDGEPHELAQAVLNLLVNALDALEEKRDGSKSIEVRLAREGERLRLDVIDDGPGVESASLARAADLFYTTKSPGKGTGLGLAIVHGIAHQHGGSLELASEPGRGFRATLFFPIAASELGRGRAP